jgi:DNA polymerase-3 subunit alpha
MTFTHLHVHTSFSLLDGISMRGDLLKKCKATGMPAMAVTDHGNLYNHMTFYKDAAKAGVKPILGMEAYIAPDSRHNREYKSGKDVEVGDISEYAYHLILLAKNAEGYHNLKQLSTLSFRQGFYRKPRIDMEILQQYRKGLIVLSGCVGSITSQLILGNKKDEAAQWMSKFRYMFGEDFYLELANHEMPENKVICDALIDFGQKLGIGTVITNDSHFTEAHDDMAHEVALCLNTNSNVKSPDHWKFPGVGYWFKTPEEMLEVVQRSGYPLECLENSVQIANKIEDYGFKLGKWQVPKFKDTKGLQWNSEDSHEKLVMMCWEGMERLGLSDKQDYIDRLNFELDMMERKNFSSYFLIIADIIRYIRDHGGMFAPIGRGSSVGSLVCYTTGITAMDPVEFSIPFYRFINEGRKDLPDVDTDISKRHRGDVIKYIQKTYGADCVAQICTFMQMNAKSAIDNVGRALDIPAAVRKTVSKLLGDEIAEDDDTDIIEDVIKPNTAAFDMMRSHSGWMDIASRLYGVHRGISVHAAGIVISNDAIDNHVPLVRDHEGFLQTQYDMKDCAELGLLKLDMLGLRTLDVIFDACKLIKEQAGVEIDIYQMKMDDPEVYKMLCEASFVSVFQYDSQGMRALSRKLHPDNFELLMALNALYRPGPMLPQKEMGSDGKEHAAPSICDIYLERRHGRQKVETWHPSLDKVLSGSFGMPLYQEQISEMSKLIAAFNDQEADEYRAAIGKKDKVKFLAAQDKFKTRGMSNGHSAEFMDFLCSRLAGFARYGWNRGHAAGYSKISYITAYLECHYPLQYYTALLNNNSDKTEKLAVLLGGIMQKGIEVRPPSVNDSGGLFTTDGTVIYMGLSSVRQLGGGALAAILWERECNGQYAGYIDFVRRVSNLQPIPTKHPLFREYIEPGWKWEKAPTIPDSFVLKSVNKTVIENLIKAGAFSFDTILTDRDKLKVVETAQKLAKKNSKVDEFAVIAKCSENLEQTEFTPLEKAALERGVLNFYISGHPVSTYTKYISMLESDAHIITPTQLKECQVQEQVLIVSLCAQKEMKVTKNDKPFISMKLQDQFGEIYCRIWHPQSTVIWPMLADGGILLVKGIVQHDRFRDGELDVKVQHVQTISQGLPITGFVCQTDAQLSSVSEAFGVAPTEPIRLPQGIICQLPQTYTVPHSILDQIMKMKGVRLILGK